MDSITVPIITVERNGEFKKVQDYISDNKSHPIRVQLNEKMLFADKAVIDANVYSGKDLQSLYTTLNLFRQEFNSKTIELKLHFISHENIGNLIGGFRKDPCVCGKKYCIRVFEDSKKIINENLYQNCILEYSYTEGPPEIFIDYMDRYEFHNNSTVTPKSIMNKMNLNEEKINECVANSFVPRLNNISDCTKDYSIKVYDNSIKYINSTSSYQISKLLINGHDLGYSRSESYIKEYICAVFAKKKLQACVGNVYKGDKGEGLTWFTIWIIVSAVLTINFILIILCRRYLTRRVKERAVDGEMITSKVNEVMSGYSQFKN